MGLLYKTQYKHNDITKSGNDWTRSLHTTYHLLSGITFHGVVTCGSFSQNEFADVSYGFANDITVGNRYLMRTLSLVGYQNIPSFIPVDESGGRGYWWAAHSGGFVLIFDITVSLQLEQWFMGGALLRSVALYPSHKYDCLSTTEQDKAAYGAEDYGFAL